MRKCLVAALFVLSALTISCSNKDSSQSGFKQNTFITGLKGNSIEKWNLLDSSRTPNSIPFGNESLTIIDFWFGDCPGCLNEMQQFDKLLRKKKTDVSIISISINSFENWKSLFNSNKKNYSFLKTYNPNWKHFVLKSNEDPRLRNDIPLDNMNLIKQKFNTHAFPIYLVLNSKGQIVETPESAVEFLNYLQEKQDK